MGIQDRDYYRERYRPTSTPNVFTGRAGWVIAGILGVVLLLYIASGPPKETIVIIESDNSDDGESYSTPVIQSTPVQSSFPRSGGYSALRATAHGIEVVRPNGRR
jgi:hypothetical protein